MHRDRKPDINRFLLRVSLQRRHCLQTLSRITENGVTGVRFEIQARSCSAGDGGGHRAASCRKPRLGTAEKSLRLLLTDDDSEATMLAAELDRQNRERQEVEKQIFNLATEKIE